MLMNNKNKKIKLKTKKTKNKVAIVVLLTANLKKWLIKDKKHKKSYYQTCLTVAINLKIQQFFINQICIV